jgi:non-ribosomal peptide synthetase component F
MRSDGARAAIRSHPGNACVEFTKEEVEQSVPERFETMAQRYPDRVAVKMKGDALTYRQLNTMANRLSLRIAARRGTDPEPVGLLFDNGIPLVAAMLGVLKAGKFFVPLEPRTATSRISQVLADTGAPLILSDESTSSLAQKAAGGKTQWLEVDAVDPDAPAADPRLPIPSGALVTALKTASGGVRLAACFTSRAQAAPSVNELRRRFEGKLPDYIIPSFFVRLDAIPF